MSEKRINEELAAVETALATLKPAASGVDRDRVMFLAGRVSAVTQAKPRQRRKADWLWPCATVVSLLLAIASSGMLFLHGAVGGEKQVVYIKVEKSKTSNSISQPLWYEDTQKASREVKKPRPRPSSGRGNMPMDYLSLSMLIAEKGVEALPGQLWIPIGPEKYPRRNLMLHDDVNMF